MRALLIAGLLSAWSGSFASAGQDPARAPLPDAPPIVHEPMPPHQSTRAATGPPLTLKAALDEALLRNPDLLVLRAQFEAARHRPAQEQSLAAPTFEAQIWQGPLRSLNPAETNMYMLTVTQSLPGRGKRDLRAAVAAKDADMASSEIAVRARETVDAVKRTYAALFVARAAIDVHLDSVDLLRQFADVSSVKYATGRIPQQDVLKAVGEIAKLHADLLLLDEHARLAAAELNTLLDRPPDTPIGALTASDDRVLLTPVDELQRLAGDGDVQPELRAAQVGVERAQAALAVATREARPDFSVSGGYMLLPHDRDAWTGTIGVTWPTAPWARGKLDAQRAEASAHIDAARARQHSAATRIRLAIYDAYVRVKTAEQRAALARTTVIPQARQTLESSRIAYQTDRVDLLAVIDSERMLLEAQMSYYRALGDLAQARADLERSAGVELTPAMLGPAPGVSEEAR
jgi:cobalt-zinc-cadmium efflux system outer membrane protein